MIRFLGFKLGRVGAGGNHVKVTLVNCPDWDRRQHFKRELLRIYVCGDRAEKPYYWDMRE